MRSDGGQIERSRNLEQQLVCGKQRWCHSYKKKGVTIIRICRRIKADRVVGGQAWDVLDPEVAKRLHNCIHRQNIDTSSRKG